MNHKLAKTIGVAVLSWGTISGAVGLTAEEAQNSSFNGSNLTVQQSSSNGLKPAESGNLSAAPTNMIAKSANDFGENKLYSMPLHNGKVDFSDDTHVAIYTTPTGGSAVLQMQY